MTHAEARIERGQCGPSGNAAASDSATVRGRRDSSTIGLSARTRGTHIQKCALNYYLRFIPAYTGKSLLFIGCRWNSVPAGRGRPALARPAPYRVRRIRTNLDAIHRDAVRHFGTTGHKSSPPADSADEHRGRARRHGSLDVKELRRPDRLCRRRLALQPSLILFPSRARAGPFASVVTGFPALRLPASSP